MIQISITENISKVFKKVKNFPYRLTITNKNVKPFTTRNTNKKWLIRVDGSDLKPIQVKKDGDMRKLEYDDKTCAITSKPLYLNGREIYFTRDGFKGTMAINKDTLLDTDVYKLKDNNDNGYNGDIDSLKGSKRVLKELNKGTRLLKLLKDNSLPLHLMMAYVGVGVAIGIIVAQYWM